MLSDEQIDQFLQQAETRLRAKASQIIPSQSEDVIALHQTEPSTSKRKAVPRLEHGLKTSSYISEKNGVAHVDPALLATPTQQKLADGLRSVEIVQKNKKEVCLRIIQTFCLSMRKIFDIFLDAVQYFILKCPAFHESFQFHSYSDSQPCYRFFSA